MSPTEVPLIRPYEEDEEPERGTTYAEIIDHLSPSKIDMYMKCPMQVEWRYVKGIKIPPAIALVEGSQYHAAAAYRNEKLRDKKRVSRIELLEYFEDNFTDMLNKGGRKEIVWGDEKESNVFNRADRMIEVLYNDLAPIERPVHVEKKVAFEVPAPESPDEEPTDAVKIVAITDLIDGGGVSDYKITTNRKTKEVADSSIQLSLYAYHFKQKRVRLDNLAKTSGGVANRLISTRGPGDFEWMKRVVHRVWLSMIAGSFPPCAPDSWCCTPKWCGYYRMCRGAAYKR